jgi:HAD superfamily hydrolase (TIGR01662 family)
MIMGAPASGKSTLTKKYSQEGYIVLNRDTEGGTIAGLLPKFEALLHQSKDVVLDNLFPTAEVRKPFVDMAKAHNADITCKVMGTSIEEAQFNVVQRAIGLIGTFPTPEAVKKAKHTNIFPPTVLFRYKKEFQKPDVSEGFSSVETVKFVRRENPEFTGKAVIVDYDGTLRECVGGNGKFPVSKEQVEMKPNRKQALQSYRDKGYLLLGVSNQSGVAKGELAYDKAVELFEYTNDQLGLPIEYRFCPHQSAPITCYCRKPGVGFGVEFILKHKLNRKECLMVGDLTSDATFAARCGFQFVHENEFFK